MEVGSSSAVPSKHNSMSTNMEPSSKIQFMRAFNRTRKIPSQDYLTKVLKSLRDPRGKVKKLMGTPINQKKKNLLESILCEFAKVSLANLEKLGKEKQSNVNVVEAVQVKQHPPDPLVDIVSANDTSAPMVEDLALQDGNE